MTKPKAKQWLSYNMYHVQVFVATSRKDATATLSATLSFITVNYCSNFAGFQTHYLPLQIRHPSTEQPGMGSCTLETEILCIIHNIVYIVDLPSSLGNSALDSWLGYILVTGLLLIMVTVYRVYLMTNRQRCDLRNWPLYWYLHIIAIINLHF